MYNFQERGTSNLISLSTVTNELPVPSDVCSKNKESRFLWKREKKRNLT